MKRLAAESLQLKTKMAESLTWVNPKVKNQTSESLSLKNLEVKDLLEKSVSKKSDGKKLHKKT